MDEANRSKVVAILQENGFGNDDVKNTDHLKHDLGLDSMDQIELIMECEVQFHISIPDSELVYIHTFGQLMEAIEKHIKENGQRQQPTTTTTSQD